MGSEDNIFFHRQEMESRFNKIKNSNNYLIFMDNCF